MDVERVALPSGQWWEIRTTVTRKMRKVFRAAGMAGFLGGIKGQDGTVDMADSEALKRLVMAHAKEWDLDAIDDAYLREGTVAWSYEMPIAPESIDALPDATVQIVLNRVRALYAEPMQEALKN
jgi:hypothetical protein